MDGPRQPDGSLPLLNFMRLAAGSDLIDAGTNIGLPFNGTAPTWARSKACPNRAAFNWQECAPLFARSWWSIEMKEGSRYSRKSGRWFRVNFKLEFINQRSRNTSAALAFGNSTIKPSFLTAGVSTCLGNQGDFGEISAPARVTPEVESTQGPSVATS